MKVSPKLTYDRKNVGNRIRKKRDLLGFSQEEIAKQIGCATKYYGDIERGSCGMSVETLMALSSVLNMPLDDIIYGETGTERKALPPEIGTILHLLNGSSKKDQEYAVRMLKLLLMAREDKE